MSGTINVNFVGVESVPSMTRLNFVDNSLMFFVNTPGVTADISRLLENEENKKSYWIRARAHQDFGDYLKFNAAELSYRKFYEFPYVESVYRAQGSSGDLDGYYFIAKESYVNQKLTPYDILVHNPQGYGRIDYQSITGESDISATEWALAYGQGLTVDFSGVLTQSPNTIIEGGGNSSVGVGTITADIETSFLNTTANEFEFAIAGEKFFKRFVEDNYILKNRMTVDAAGCISRTIREDRYKSPAGLQRGRILNAEAVRPEPNDYLNYLYNLNINYVNNFDDEFYLFGDKTRAQDTSTFSRLNVSLLFIYLKKLIAPAIRTVLFEQNDSTTRTRISNEITRLLRKIQGEDGITDFRVVCDETNNTPDIIDSNNLVVDVFVKPKKSINFIKIRFTNTENL